MEPQTHYIHCCNALGESYRMFYTSWGIRDNAKKVLLCLHGLNRNGRDWDFIAKYFARIGYYVIAPDIVGRGNSDYLKNPLGYTLVNYTNDIINLINTLQLAEHDHSLDIIGTSMGGVIAFNLIAASMHNPLFCNMHIHKVVFNDIGIRLEEAGLNRILSYNTDRKPIFATFQQAQEFLVNNSTEFGDLPESVWQHMAKHMFCINMARHYELKRDNNIAYNFTLERQASNPQLLWQLWLAVKIPCLIIHGSLSDLLSHQTVVDMCNNNSNASFVEFAGIGHAPFLYSNEHCELLADFLAS